jgi:hypothetical protein
VRLETISGSIGRWQHAWLRRPLVNKKENIFSWDKLSFFHITINCLQKSSWCLKHPCDGRVNMHNYVTEGKYLHLTQPHKSKIYHELTLIAIKSIIEQTSGMTVLDSCWKITLGEEWSEFSSFAHQSSALLALPSTSYSHITTIKKTSHICCNILLNV